MMMSGWNVVSAALNSGSEATTCAVNISPARRSVNCSSSASVATSSRISSRNAEGTKDSFLSVWSCIRALLEPAQRSAQRAVHHEPVGTERLHGFHKSLEFDRLANKTIGTEAICLNDVSLLFGGSQHNNWHSTRS